MGRLLWKKRILQLGRPCILVPLKKPAGDHATFQPCPLAGIQSSHAPLSPYHICPLTSRWPSVRTGLSLHLHNLFSSTAQAVPST